MAGPDGKGVEISRKDIYEIRVGNKEPLHLSQSEAEALMNDLGNALREGKEQAPEELGVTAPRDVSVRPIKGKKGPLTPRERTRQTTVMSGIVILVIAASFFAYNISLPPASHFKPPKAPYEHFYLVGESDLRFNGTSPGPSLTAPNNTTVWVSFTVASSSPVPHSWVLVPGNTSANATLPIPPVFPNASSPNYLNGSKPGTTDQIIFKVDKVGTYKYICEVPGHFGEGMYGYLNVTASNATNATSLPSLSSNHSLNGEGSTGQPFQLLYEDLRYVAGLPAASLGIGVFRQL